MGNSPSSRDFDLRADLLSWVPASAAASHAPGSVVAPLVAAVSPVTTALVTDALAPSGGFFPVDFLLHAGAGPLAAQRFFKIAPPAAGPGLSQDQVAQLVTGFDQTLSKIEGDLITQVFGDSLPLLGSHLASAAAGGAPALHYVTALKAALSAGLGTLTGAANYTQQQVEQALGTALKAAGIQPGAGPTLDLSNLADIHLAINTTDTFAAFDTALDADFGLPGLGLQSTGTAHTTVNYTFNFAVGLDGAGFYLNTADNASTFHAGFNTQLAGLDVSGNLSQLRFHITDESATDGDNVAPTLFAGNFVVDLLDPGTQGADDKLRLGELAPGADLLNATLNGTARINLNLASDLGTAVLPNLAADLNVEWGFNNAVVDAGAGPANFGLVPTVAFNHVSLGLGSFFSDFVSPVFSAVQTLTDPLQPIVDVLQTRIGFLSDLAGHDVTLLDVAGGTGAISPETAARLDLYSKLISFINAPRDGGDVRIDLGDYSLGGQDPRAALFQLVNAAPQALRAAIPLGSQDAGLGSFLDGKTALPGGGLAFPIIENPSTAINLLFGKPVDFFSYHVPGLDIDPQGINYFYRIFGPFGVRLEATVEAHAHLDIGYDSTGLAQFAASGMAKDIFNGFYVVDQPGPEATLTATLQAFAAVNVVLAEMGVGGGITANLNAALNDTDTAPGDGRIHLAQLNNSCDLIGLSGAVNAGLSAYLTLGWGPFSETFERDLGHEVLLSFDAAGCNAAGQPGVPVLAHAAGANVLLHVGTDAALQVIGARQDSAEDFVVIHSAGALGSEGIAVIGNGLVSESGDKVAPQPFTVGANGHISANGGDLDDTLALKPDVLSPAIFHGGIGNDRLIGGAGDDDLLGDAGLDLLVGGGGRDTLTGGAEQDYLDGQDGDDTLLGGSEADTLVGGAGADGLNGGSGFDTASYVSAPIGVLLNLALPGSGTGDAQGDSYVSIERIVGSAFADALLGAAGNDNFGGGAGDDLLDGREGDDLLSGDAGADQLIGGSGTDFAAYTLSAAAVSVSLFTGQGSGGDAQGDTLSGIENLQGSDFADVLEGDNGANWLRGLNGANILRGLGGDDLLEGGRDGDTLEGGEGADTLRASLDVNSVDPQASGGIDTLRGGAGNDVLYGDAGADLLDGGDGADQIFGGRDADTVLGGAGDDQINGGAGNDVIDAGDGLNRAHGDDGDDAVSAGLGNDLLYGDAGNDVLTDLAGNNQLFGGVGDDVLTAGAGNDVLAGGSGNDRLDAGNGSNQLNGDAGNDVLISGSGNDTVDGGVDDDSVASGAGNDVVVGGDGNDTLDAGTGTDRVDGGLGNDVLSVGAMRSVLQDSERNDHLFGGAGFDVISADFSNQTAAISVFAGITQSLVFADGTEARDFENVHDLFTGSGNDVLRLDGAADDGFGNLLKTGAGQDTVYGGNGSDTIDGGGGDDFVNGGFNDVVLTIELGFGTVVGFTGPVETLAGGAGIDTLSFEGFFGVFPSNVAAGRRLGVAVDLSNNQTGGAATGITISGFENLIGTDYGDNLVGDDGANVFNPLHGGGYTENAVTSGPDRIDGRGGIDTLFIDYSREDLASSGGITSSAGSTVNGGSYGRQTPASGLFYQDSVNFFAVEKFHIIGASKNDQITGGGFNYDDVLSGLGGNDTLGGNGGSDVLLGGADNDVLSGQGSFAAGYNGSAGGHDGFDGGSGDDLVEDIAFDINNFSTFSLAADALFQLDGGSGMDTLSVDFSNQTAAIVWTSNAPTNIEFADGAYARNFEVLRYFASGSGNDVISQGGRLNNLFALGAGDDTVNPGLGVDTVDAGTGFDTAILDFSLSDTADLSGVQGGGYADGGTYYRVQAGNRIDNIDLRNFERVQITGSGKDDNLSGTLGDDTLVGGDGNDRLDGNRGGNNMLDGGNGDDVLIGSYGMNGTGADDTLFGRAGNDILNPLTGSDTAYGGADNDRIVSADFSGNGYGIDVFDGGDGDDVVSDGYFNSGFTSATAATRLMLDGGTGFDQLSADFGKQTQTIVFVGGASNSIDFADGSYFRNFESLGNFTAGSGNDQLTVAGRSDNALGGGDGDDTINPGLGLDYVYGGNGDDLLILDYSLGDGANLSGVSLNGNFLQRQDINTLVIFDSILINGFERYQITGGSHADRLLAGDSTDALVGNGGNDVLSGGAGIDTLTGGSGADHFSDTAANLHLDRITDFSLDDFIDVAGLRFSAVRYGAATGLLELDAFNSATFPVHIHLAAGLVGEFVATASAAGQPASTQVRLMADSDGDGVGDFHDNAIFAFNPNQRDADHDGYGNVADADFNQDLMVDFFDLSIFEDVFGSADPVADLNGDGVVDFVDLSMLDALFGKAPGPSYIDPPPPAPASADRFDFGLLRPTADAGPGADLAWSALDAWPALAGGAAHLAAQALPGIDLGLDMGAGIDAGIDATSAADLVLGLVGVHTAMHTGVLAGTHGEMIC